MSTFVESIEIAAPRSRVWQVLADIGSIQDWNPGVRESRTTSTSGSGLGATRYCDLGGRNYLRESVVEFTENEAITMRIDDSNLPFRSADIRFTLESTTTGTRVSVSPDYKLKYALVGRLLDSAVVSGRYQRGMADLLVGLKSHLEDPANSQ